MEPVDPLPLIVPELAPPMVPEDEPELLPDPMLPEPMLPEPMLPDPMLPLELGELLDPLPLDCANTATGANATTAPNAHTSSFFIVDPS